MSEIGCRITTCKKLYCRVRCGIAPHEKDWVLIVIKGFLSPYRCNGYTSLLYEIGATYRRRTGLTIIIVFTRTKNCSLTSQYNRDAR